MKPIGLLMREHRLIERLIKLLEKEFNTINNTKEADTNFIKTNIDFFKIYNF